ncbi:GTP cyclohydrolase I FolE [Bdellovibrio sp. HCB2-146]|uniref:GTP cyclohydrolase I FolE n=1 Tax=Bdellovibrio sp. HCB2-146 TaxID=3394362 RepID=UPI0039BD1EBC
MAKKTTKTSKKSSPKVVKKASDEIVLSTKSILDNVRPTPMKHNGLSNEDKIQIISEKFTEIMETLGLDLEDDSLSDTPRRVAKMYVNEVFGGLDPHKFPKMTVIDNKMNYDQMIVVQKISSLSFCEHHFLPIDGYATVAYIPNKKVIGLSKINRIVQFFSRRPQVQERLTKQIADCLQYVLGTEHVAVHISAKHYCVIMRGIEDTDSVTSTADLRGHFKSKMDTREEFLQHCKTKV